MVKHNKQRKQSASSGSAQESRTRESPKPPTALKQMSCAELWVKICEVGTIFKNNSTLQAEIEANGIDGAMLAFMSDADIVEFFVDSCGLAKLQASMLLAKIKFWNA